MSKKLLENLIYFMTALMMLAGFGVSGYAMDLDPAEIRGPVEKNPVTILQNRYFTKTWRPELGFTVGTFLNEAYTDTSLSGLRGALFVNEWLGFEYQYIKTRVKDSDDRKALNHLTYRRLDDDTVVSPDPEVNKIIGASDVNAILAPFYGKLNLMDRLILYTDLYITGGLSKVETDQGSLNALTFGIGERFYWQKSLSFRIDFRDRTYTEKRAGRDSQKNAYSVDLGLSYFFL